MSAITADSIPTLLGNKGGVAAILKNKQKSLGTIS
jgi:hypothetical protein